MSNIQQEYWLKNKQTIRSTIDEDNILWYQSDYVEWLEKELAASRGSRTLSAVPSDFKKRLMESAVLDNHFYHIGEIIFDGLIDELE